MARVFVLGTLVLALGVIVYRQGFGWRLGGAPALLDTSYHTEEAWIAGEIVRDVTEMSAYAVDRHTRPDVPQPQALGAGRYAVLQVATLITPVEINLSDDPWSPAAYLVVARAALGPPAPKRATLRGAVSINASINASINGSSGVSGVVMGGAISGTSGDASSIHVALTSMTPASIVRAAQAVSKSLAADIRDPQAHDRAALVIGAFALRESADVFSDVRWALNRITAHLAMAAALRTADEAPSIDGALALATLQVLTRRDTRALDQLARLGARRPSVALEAWRRALQVRVTQDWRAITLSPATTGIEELEYLRARRHTISGPRSLVEAATLQVGRADALRIAESGADADAIESGSASGSRIGNESGIASGSGTGSGIGIDDGRVIAQEALDHEREEVERVYQMIHARALFDGPDRGKIDDGVSRRMNARAGRAIAQNGPDVLPWGAWAEFSQRHIAMLVRTVDRFYRQQIGSEESAESARRAFDAELSGLTMFPVAASMRTQGVASREADLTHINEAIDLASTTPELIAAAPWAWLQAGSRYGAVRRAMPAAAKWFIPTSAHMPYDAALRLQHVGQVQVAAPLLSALLTESPFDYWLAAEYLRVTRDSKKAAQPSAASTASASTAHAATAASAAVSSAAASSASSTASSHTAASTTTAASPEVSSVDADGEVQRVFGARLGYDLRAIRDAVGFMHDAEAALILRARGCELATAECARHAWALVQMGRADEAARQFERAFDDPAYDRGAFAADAGWLVSYYFERKQIENAMDLADEAAETGAQEGLTTAAYLYERLGRGEDAEQLYERGARRYDDPSQLLGFYYRALHERNQVEFERGWNRWMPATFPEGLLPAAPVAGAAPKPDSGVTVTKDNTELRGAGLQAGDVIVGVEGYRVDNLKQFRAINAFSERPDRKLTVWRGRIYEVNLPGRSWRNADVQLRTYPIQGFAE